MLQLPGIPRRRVLQIGAVGLTGLALPGLLRAEHERRRPARAKACLLLYMDGGPSHIDTFDLKPAAPDEVRGPFRPIATSVPGVQVCEHLPRLAGQMHRVMQIRSVRHEESVHDPAVYQMLTGYKHISSAGGLEVEPTDLPHMAAAFGRADSQPATMPKVIHVPETMKMQSRVLPGQSAGILGASYDPFEVHVTREGEVTRPDFRRLEEIPPERLAHRGALLEQLDTPMGRVGATAAVARLDTFQQQALAILASSEVHEAFELQRESAALRDRYGRHRHGQSVLLARRLIEAGARFVTVYWGNEEQDWAEGRGPQLANNPWDTHRNHFPLVRDSLLPRADQALAALLEDLAERGLLDETLVVWMGDFGRTPRISRPWASRDHWPHAFTVLLAGAGVEGGGVYGRTDRLAAEVVADPVTPADLTATIFAALGVGPDAVVPSAAGMPHRLSLGQPIDSIFS